MLRARLLASMILAGAMLGACVDEPEPMSPGVNANKVPSPASGRHPGEAAFEEVSQAAPSFAGFFLEGDQLVVLVTDMKERSAAQAAVRQALAERMMSQADPRIAAAAVSVRSARYSFMQLREWRDQLQDEGFSSLPDAAWIDLDEARNEIAIGLADGSGRPEVEQALSKLAVPAAAVRFEVTGREMPTKTLSDRFRPLMGGIANAVRFGNGGLIPPCTFSFTARQNGTNVILASSHCTEHMYRVDDPPSVFYQNKIVSGDRIGPEWRDPPAFNGNERNSDAVMIRYPSNLPFELGFIARTESRSTTWGVKGSRTIDASNPRFRITGVITSPMQGSLVHKVGRTTGWTSGEVIWTCVDMEGSDGFWRNCSHRAGYFSDDGDSGSPVFIRGSGSDVTLVGIAWGNRDNSEDSAFSPMAGVFKDFGAMTVTPPPPLTASIQGPRVVGPGDTCTWTAVGSGGVPPYSYTWHGLLSGSGRTITGAINQSGGLSVVITDNANSSYNTGIGIVVNPTAPFCGGTG